MGINKKIFCLLLNILSLSILSGCSFQLPDSIRVNNELSGKVENDSNLIVDAGSGKKTNASISVKVIINNFGIKSSDGVTGKSGIDVQGIRFWLLEGTTGTAPTGTIPNASGAIVKTVDFTGSGVSTHTVTFSNVPNNNSGKSYFVAAAAYSVPAGSFSSINNITNIPNSTLSFSGENAIISTTGGDTTTPNLGSIRVVLSKITPIGQTSDLGIALKLLNATGATIDSTVTVTPGTSTYSGPAVLQ